MPSDSRTELLKKPTLESVKALYLLRRTRRHALLPHNKKPDVHGCLGSDDAGRSGNRKQKRRFVEDYAVTRKKWKQMEATTRGRRSQPQAEIFVLLP
jgi:hypothetical protein